MVTENNFNKIMMVAGGIGNISEEEKQELQFIEEKRKEFLSDYLGGDDNFKKELSEICNKSRGNDRSQLTKELRESHSVEEKNKEFLKDYLSNDNFIRKEFKVICDKSTETLDKNIRFRPIIDRESKVICDKSTETLDKNIRFRPIIDRESLLNLTKVNLTKVNSKAIIDLLNTRGIFKIK